MHKITRMHFYVCVSDYRFYLFHIFIDLVLSTLERSLDILIVHYFL